MDLSQITLETKRLLLVSGTTKYVEQIFLEYRDPVIQYMNYGPPESLKALRDFMKKREGEMMVGTQLFVVVLLKDSNEFLGCMALEGVGQKNPEMGGWLKQVAHGNGYGREAAAALKLWADKNLDYNYIVWPCARQNMLSRKLAESLGGQVKKEYEKKTVRGKVWPFVEYWIFKNKK